MTQKLCSKPINQVNEVVYRHDVCYDKNKDTENLNKACYKQMVRELDAVSHRTFEATAQSKPIFCLKCQEKTGTLKAHKEMSMNNRPMLKGVCNVCKSKKSTFLPMS